MNQMDLNALCYVQNTGGGTTKDNFMEDHEPIGNLLWAALEKEQLVEIRDGKIYPTKKGEETITANKTQ